MESSYERFGTEESMNLEIASRLVALRKDNHLSQEALAEKLGISRQAVSKWERAEASPDTDNLIALAKLYHVSLDELLRIHDEEETDSLDIRADGNETESLMTTQISTQEESRENDVFADQAEDGCQDEPADGTSGQTGQNDEKEVHIGFHGIHVKERNGDEVHIGWDGIHVCDKDNEVHIDKNGIYVNGEEAGEHIFMGGRSGAGFPLLLFAVAAHIITGICFGAWWTGWLIYLLVPVIDSFIYAVRCKNAYLFAYPVLVTFIFLYAGLVHYIWHPTWIVFLTIPLYYSFLRFIRNRGEKE